MNPRLWVGGLLAAEEGLIRGAVPKRRQEFTAGRNCARQALRILGLPANQAKVPIGVGSHREPIFPTGVIGSISHCNEFCAAAVARTGGALVGIGIDVEVNRSLDLDVASLVMSPQERHIWESSLRPRGIPVTIAFSIKEAFFKAVFLRCRRYLDFSDAWLTPALSENGGDFSITAIDPHLKACLEGLRVFGRFAADADHVYSVVTLVH
jgi:4'-phosphopantetheinyl transferase EntD